MVVRFLKLFLAPAIIIILVSLYTAYPSFKLALFGDDWQQLWNYFHYLSPKASIFEHFRYFIGGYGAFEVMTGLLYSVFGHDYKMYYIFSYLYKLIAAFCVWPLIFYLTRSKLAALYASLFLSVTTIGLETTNWVINSPAYLAVANVPLFLYFFVKSRENLKVKSFIFALLFFYLAHIFAPIRMTGLLAFTFFLEFFLYLRSPHRKATLFPSEIKLSLLRLFVIFITFVIIATTGASAEKTGSLITEASTTLNSGFSTISTLLKHGRTDFLFYPIMTVGRIVLPYSIKPEVPIFFLSLISFIVVLVLNIPRGVKVLYQIIAVLGGWTLVSWLVYKINITTLSLNDAISLALGGYILALGIIFLKFSFKQILSISFFIGIFWTLFSFIFTWVRAAETLLPTEHRYLIPSALGMTILLSSIIGLGSTFKNRLNLFLLLVPFVIINIFTTKGFFEDVVENSHGSETMNKIWSAFPYIPEIGKTEKPVVFYFDSTPNKYPLKHHSLTFGFPYRMAMAYDIYDEDVFDSLARMPFAVNDWKDVVAAVSDERYSKGNDFTKTLVPIENVYAFYLTSDNNLVNITDQVRNKLKEELRK